MISNDEQLAVVKEQVQRLESGLNSLEATVRPKSEKQFQVFSQGWIDQLKILRDEIAEYESSRHAGARQTFRPASDSPIKA